MNREQKEHLQDIKEQFLELVDKKYKAGAKEHGGNIWEIPIDNLLDEAIDEAVDQVVYLLTLKEQLEYSLNE